MPPHFIFSDTIIITKLSTNLYPDTELKDKKGKFLNTHLC